MKLQNKYPNGRIGGMRKKYGGSGKGCVQQEGYGRPRGTIRCRSKKKSEEQLRLNMLSELEGLR